MIKQDFYKVREDGVRLIRIYSDQNVMVKRDGIVYEDAIEIDGTDRVYTETNIPIEPPHSRTDDYYEGYDDSTYDSLEDEEV